MSVTWSTKTIYIYLYYIEMLECTMDIWKAFWIGFRWHFELRHQRYVLVVVVCFYFFDKYILFNILLFFFHWILLPNIVHRISFTFFLLSNLRKQQTVGYFLLFSVWQHNILLLLFLAAIQNEYFAFDPLAVFRNVKNEQHATIKRCYQFYTKQASFHISFFYTFKKSLQYTTISYLRASI